MRHRGQLARHGVGLSIVLALAAWPQARAGEVEPIESGLTEETEVRRIFVDVEVVDEDGRPMPGLTKKDFKFRLNYTWRQLKTVDDLCPCSENGTEIPAAPGNLRDQVVRDEVATRYVLYFDFSMLSAGSRLFAIGHARSWIRHTMLEGEEVMILAHSTESGLRELTPFTTDRDRLQAALDEAIYDPALNDPFPSNLGVRMAFCADGRVSCRLPAREDYRKTRASLWAVIAFLTRLDTVGGRKALMLFHENLTIFPGRLYALPGIPLAPTMIDGSDTDDVPDHLELIQEVGAAAVVARTEIYPIVVGNDPTAPGNVDSWNVNFGANLADFTGGEHNSTLFDTDALMRKAGRGCKCIYRLGLEPPTGKTRIYRTKVKVRGRALKDRHRVHYLAPIDQWSRNAESVLTNPHDAWGLNIDAALVPGPVRDERWELEARIAVDFERLQPPEDGRRLEWETGALLSELDSGRSWEMLGLSRLDPRDLPPTGTRLLHRRVFEELRPGRYELRAFIRDRASDTYGGARALLELPAPTGGSVAGPPRALAATDRWWEFNLPLRRRWNMIEQTETLARVNLGEEPDFP